VDGPGGGASAGAAGVVIGEGVRNLLEEPVFAIVTLADGVIDIVRKELRIFDIPAPVEVVVALEELRAVAVGNADVPELLTVADGLPCELAEIERLARGDGDGRLEYSPRTPSAMACSSYVPGRILAMEKRPSADPRVQNS